MLRLKDFVFVELVQLFCHRYFSSFTESSNTRLHLVLSSLGFILFLLLFLDSFLFFVMNHDKMRHGG